MESFARSFFGQRTGVHGSVKFCQLRMFIRGLRGLIGFFLMGRFTSRTHGSMRSCLLIRLGNAWLGSNLSCETFTSHEEENTWLERIMPIEQVQKRHEFHDVIFVSYGIHTGNVW